MLNIKIKEKIISNAFISYEKGDKSIIRIKRTISETVKKLNSFYKIETPLINIELLYSRKEFDKKLCRKTPDWLVGSVGHNLIYLLSPNVLQNESSHKKSEFKKILTHELCHIYNFTINKNILMWVDEGVALFFANQKKIKSFIRKDLDFFYNNFLNRNIKLGIFAQNNGYPMSYFLVKKMFAMFGKRKILEIIKIDRKKIDCDNLLNAKIGVLIKYFFKKYK